MDPIRWQNHRLRNFVQSTVLLTAMAMLLGTLGWLLAGSLGVMLAAAGIFIIGSCAPGVSPKLTLQLSGARELPYNAAPELHSAVHELSKRAGLDAAPTLHYVPNGTVNAFALGNTRNSALAVSEGLLRVLSRRELTGVLAHELSHIRNGDTWVLGLAGLLNRITTTLALAGGLLLLLSIPLVLMGASTVSLVGVLVLLLAPKVSGLLQLALSRTREYDADLGAVSLTNDPAGLASAFDKLSHIERGWLRRMFRMGRADPPELLRTHPATSERIRRLNELVVNQPMASSGWTSRGDHAQVTPPVARSDLAHYRPRRARWPH